MVSRKSKTGEWHSKRKLKRPAKAHRLWEYMDGKRSYPPDGIAAIVAATDLPLPPGPISDKYRRVNDGGKEVVKTERKTREQYILEHLELAASLYASQIAVLDQPAPAKLKKRLGEIEEVAGKLLGKMLLVRHPNRPAPPDQIHSAIRTQAKRIIQRAPKTEPIDLGLIEPVLEAIDGVRLLQMAARMAATKIGTGSGEKNNPGHPEFEKLVLSWKRIFEAAFCVPATARVSEVHKEKGIEPSIDSPFIRFCVAAAAVIGLHISRGSILGYLGRNRA